jgi:hypothetical protein
MFRRSLSLLVAALAAGGVLAVTAVAQTVSNAPPPVSPAPGSPAAPGSPGAPAAPGTPGAPSQPGACVDQTAPVSSYTAKQARSAARNHVLRGSASDVGCGVDRVDVSVAKKSGKNCRFLATNHKLARSASCAKPRWLHASGTKNWTLRMPKRLAAGTYTVTTRATDFAGNTQALRSHSLKLR